MIYKQIYQALLNKKKIFFILFFIFSFYFIVQEKVFSVEVYPIVRINNEIITNIDAINEIEILKYQLKEEKDLNLIKNIAIKNLIELKIKYLETQNLKLSKNLEEAIVQQTDIFYKKIIKNIEKDIQQNQIKLIKKIILKKTEINFKWNDLIKKLYLSSININPKEIDYISKNKKMSKKEKDNLILSEQNKKLIKFSLSHFNKIKKKYIIEYQ